MTYRKIRIQVYMLNVDFRQQSLCLLTGLWIYLPRSMALLVKKLGEEKNCQNPFLEKKIQAAIKLKGGWGVRP